MDPQHNDTIAAVPPSDDAAAGPARPVEREWAQAGDTPTGRDLARIKARVLELRALIDPLYVELRRLEQVTLEAEAPFKVHDEIEWTPTTGNRSFRGVVLGIFRSGDGPAYRTQLKYRDGTLGETREVFPWYNPRRIAA